jgi:hypothetical protein
MAEYKIGFAQHLEFYAWTNAFNILIRSSTWFNQITVNGDTVTSGLNVTNTANFGDGYAGSGATFESNGHLSTKGTLSVDQTLIAVAGTSSFSSGLYVGTGDPATTGATIYASGTIQTLGSLSVAQTSTLLGQVDIGGGYMAPPAGSGATITGTGGVSINGDFHAGSQSTFSGLSQFDGNLQLGTLMPGSTNLISSTGTIQVSGGITTNGGMSIGQTSSLGGSVSIGGGYGAPGVTISEAGHVSVNGNFLADQVSTFIGGANILGSVSLGKSVSQIPPYTDTITIFGDVVASQTQNPKIDFTGSSSPNCNFNCGR